MASDPVYSVKRVDFFGRSVKVCLQNINGPCPLLAIANVLSLRNELKLPSGISEISQGQLITMVADVLLERNKHADFSAEHAAYLHQNLADAFEVLQKLTTGIDVNVKFHNVFAFEPTKEVTVFDLLGIPLVHGWLVDPADQQLAGVIGTRSYNELVEVMLAGMEPAAAQQLMASSSLGRHSTGGLTPPTAPAVGPSTSEAALQGGPPHTAAAAEAEAEASTPQPAAQPPAGATASAAQAQAGLGTHSPSSDGGTAEKGLPSSAQHAGLAQQHAGDVVAGTPLAGGAGEAVEDSTEAVVEDILCTLVTSLSASQELGAIQLGASPTRSDSLSRKLAYQAAGGGDQQPGSSGTSQLLEQEGPCAGGQQQPGQQPHQQQQAQQQQQVEPAEAGAAGQAVPQPEVAPQTAQGSSSPAGGVARTPSSSTASILLQEFFEAHCTQLTPYGVSALGSSLKEHQLAVLFRNNHFSTLFKYEEAVFLLVTDQGYVHEPDIVWERLDSVAGDTSFFTARFEPFVPHAAPPSFANMDEATQYDAAIAASLAAEQEAPAAAPPAGAGAPQQVDELEDADYRLALQLQLQEEEALRERQAIIAAQEASAAQPQHQAQRQQAYHQQQQQQQQQQRYPAARAPGMSQQMQQQYQYHQGYQQQYQQQPQQQGQQAQGMGRGRPQANSSSGGGLPGIGRGLGQAVEEAKEKCSIM